MRMNMARNSPMRRASLALPQRQLVHQDRNENDIVDAEHELERGQSQEGDPRLRIAQQFDHCSGIAGARNTTSRARNGFSGVR